jgi:DNA-binding response OmpR family regulator/two-component sensor histidine kinase
MEKGTELIKRNGQNLLKLVNQMLDLSKLEAGMVPVNLIQGDLVVYLKYLLESFQSLAQKRNISLEFRSIHNSIILDFDPEKMREICSNLISNAIKYNKDGGHVLLDAEVIDQDYGSKKSVRISVEDNGKGIPEHILPSIFDRFTRGQVGPSGAGIGLALTKELVKLLGGKIDVESTLGKGSRFTITLPVFNNAPITDKPIEEIQELGYNVMDHDDPVVEGSMISKDQAATQTLPMLLLVEDSNDVVVYIVAQLKSTYKVVVARNGIEGWEKATEIVPDIIVSDVMMPEMDGLELLQRLKSDMRTSHIPVILLTAKADIESRLSGLERGADAYLTKPFYKSELEVRLRKLIESRRMLHERYRQIQFSVSESPDLKIEDAFIHNIHEILSSQIGNEHFGIPELCQSMSMSRTQLYRKFSALTDQSIGHYFRTLRLNKAKELIKHSKMNITQIAFEVGFNDSSYFSRIFKEETGISPKNYRKDITNN